MSHPPLACDSGVAREGRAPKRGGHAVMSRATAQSNTQRHWPQKHIAIAAPALYIDMSRAVAHTSESALDATHELALTETVDLLPAFTRAAHDAEGPLRGALYSRHRQRGPHSQPEHATATG